MVTKIRLQKLSEVKANAKQLLEIPIMYLHNLQISIIKHVCIMHGAIIVNNYKQKRRKFN